ncbi:cholinesterase-like isoform X2 [Pseudoliparis swirei]|uniref:cholinesterase-like isoform X2 n=1 Tax=Pseudoliparis swirei TaxID=2059687 RepID=UPI0024BE407E|nr:cholinesterase-like isoform X2 [Pseudoliparis swirei]
MAKLSPCSRITLLLLLPHFLTVSPATPDDLVINTGDGKVQGKLLSVLGGNIRAFLGIPYGKPPVGKLRFSPPEPAESWEGVRDATQFSNSCYQLPDTTFPGFYGSEMWNANTPLSEDCLYLNVWTPRFNKTQPKPLAHVLVWVYGGAFNSGTSSLDLYDGRFLSKSEDVVIVSMNYRLGALGFLTTPADKNLQGNAGLMDQRLALQWVAKNIAAFGGDSSKVTLFGESAGSASVGFHLISPGSQSLFQRAVMQSGSPNAPWAIFSQDETWRRSTKLATLLGCPQSSPSDMKACLQQADPMELTLKQYDVIVWPSLIGIPFGPYVDGHFLQDTVEVLLSTGKLPKKDVLFGINKEEGTYFLIYAIPGFNNTGQSLITRDEFLKGVHISMKHASDATRDMATFHYTDWTDENNSMTNRDSLGSLVGDQMITCPALEFARRYSQHGGKTFLYSFDHRSSVNPWPEWMGAMHGYEIEFVFGMPLNASLGYTKKEVDMTKKFMKHWANFARTGNPGIDGDNWPTFTPEKQEYVTLNTNPPERKMKMNAKECHLWNTFLPKVQKRISSLVLQQMGFYSTVTTPSSSFYQS